MRRKYPGLRNTRFLSHREIEVYFMARCLTWRDECMARARAASTEPAIRRLETQHAREWNRHALEFLNKLREPVDA